jgi:IclR family acetate operon transcriptional repressor
VRLLERAIDLLECLGNNRGPMGVRGLESATGVPKATAQRLLDVFDRRGYVQKDGGRYALAPGTVRLARSYLAGDSLITVATPILQGLAALSGETCALYVRQGFDRILVQHVESPHPLRHKTPIGERMPLHLGASGQVLCAGMPADLLQRHLDLVAPARLASGKVLRKKDLLARCEQVRLRGYAVAVDERFEGVTAVAAPVVHRARGLIAAINIAGPSTRMAEKLQQLSIDVRNAARDVSDKLNRL